MGEIYLDHCATTWVLPEVIEAMRACYRAGPANPSSPHACGQRARRMLEESRECMAAVLGARIGGPANGRPDRLILTSGATEANNLALRGLGGGRVRRVVVSAIEHPSVLRVAMALERAGCRLRRLRVDRNGVIDIDQALAEIGGSNEGAEAGAVASVQLVNNETGVVQPVERLAARCREAGVLLHTDAAQAVGKIPIHFQRLGVDALSFSAHKLHGPPGAGVLIVRGGVPIEPILLGGPQEDELRAGTQAVALAVGMAAALQSWQRQQTEGQRHLAFLRDRFERTLRGGWPDLVVHGESVQRAPHISSVAFPGLNRQALLMAFDLAGIACAGGAACASGALEPSHVLQAMGCARADLDGSLRFSFSTANTPGEVDDAVRRIIMVCRGLQQRKSAGISPFMPPLDRPDRL